MHSFKSQINGNRATCPFCNKLLATHDQDAYKWRGVDFCYMHVVMITREEDVLFPRLDSRRNGFDFDDFVKQTNKAISQNGRSRNVAKTIRLMDDFMKRIKMEEVLWQELA